MDATNADLPVYEVHVGDTAAEQVVGLSLVDMPAIQSTWIALNAEAITPVADPERRVVYGPAMIPGKLVYRDRIPGYNGAGYFVFSEETSRKMAAQFMRSPGPRGITVMHLKSIDTAYMVESWVVEDPAVDKSRALGLPAMPKGTWMAAVKIEDENFWADYVKTGLLTGFSIEGAYLPITEHTPKQPTPQTLSMKATNWFQKYVSAKPKPKTKAPAHATALMAQGIPVRVGEVDALVMVSEDGTAMMVPMTGGEFVGVPDGEYPAGDGVMRIVGGKVQAGEVATVELSELDMQYFKADFGELKLPAGFESTELMDGSGNFVGRLSLERASGGNTNPADSTEPAVPLEVAALRSQVEEMGRKIAALSAQSVQTKQTGAEAAPNASGKTVLSTEDAIAIYREMKELRHGKKK